MKRQILFLLLLLLAACRPPQPASFPVSLTELPPAPPPDRYIPISRNVPVAGYFEYIDSLVARHDSLLPYSLTEHLLVRANSWLIDSLAATDYYRLMARGRFVYDPGSLIVLHRGDSLLLPGEELVRQLQSAMAATELDINIPEFTLRILENGQTCYTFPIRVGQNRSKYLAMAGRTADLRTRTGEGVVYRINRDADFINPVNNKPYHSTLRDDGRRTLLPHIPWIEPMLDGQHYGQLIHPTTNPSTLGKAWSNGCIGMAEADMWRVYYHAPIGTRVVVRYELAVTTERGNVLCLEDIYPGYPQTGRMLPDQEALCAGEMP